MSDQSARESRQRVLRLEAVVLRHIEWGEADRLLWLFSLEHGKMRALAKGVRKIRSRKAGHLEPLTRVKLLLAKGRDIFIITQADTLDAYLSLRENLEGLTYASYVVELLDRFTYEEGENKGLFRLLVETLERLGAGEDRELIIRYFEIRLLDLVGFRPQLFRCLGCGEEIVAQDQYFSFDEGGILCPKCAAQRRAAYRGSYQASGEGDRERNLYSISMEALKYMRHFQRSSFTDARRARLSVEINHEIEDITQHYLTFLLERGLNTPAFLRRLRKDRLETERSHRMI